MSKHNRLIIFDFDGTLANSIPLALETANELSKWFNYPKVNDFKQVQNQSAIDFILKQIPIYKLPLWIYLMKRELKKKADRIPLYEGVPELLFELHPSYRLGIIGGGKVSYHNIILDRHQCNYFDFKIGNTALKKEKAIKSLITKGYKKENILMIGDDLHDIDAAIKSGVHYIAVSYGTSSIEILKHHRISPIAETVTDIKELIHRSFS